MPTMKTMQVPPPQALVHLRDGAVHAGNPALVRGLRDLASGRVGGLWPIHVFEPRPGGEERSLTHSWKRVRECRRLARTLKAQGVELRVSLGEESRILPAALVRLDARVIYTSRDDPRPDPGELAMLEHCLRDWDLLPVPGWGEPDSEPLWPFWREGDVTHGLTPDDGSQLLQRFLRDPAASEESAGDLRLAAAILDYFRDEES